jgi:hypothetical protein
MKWTFTLIYFLLASLTLQAQNITGIWRGYFLAEDRLFPEKYRYEIQINQTANNALQGVTYTYKSTVFYAKCSLQGINMKKGGSVLIRELKTLELKIAPGSTDCPMTCYLTYDKAGNLETLEGTYTSVNSENGTDCGSGRVYLEKVPESDFEKEDFLKGKKNTITPRTDSARRMPLKKSTPVTVAPKTTPNNTTKPTTTPKKAAPPVAKKISPKPAVTPKQTTKPSADSTPAVVVQPPSAPVKPKAPEPKVLPPAPTVIKERDNKLVSTIAINSPDIQIDLYDNGEIDNDTITVYHNNQVIANRRKLDRTPITIKIKASEEDPYHEFIMVANNLGDIAPNTALMVIRAGSQKYELFLSTNEQNNAKVIIRYKPNEATQPNK